MLSHPATQDDPDPLIFTIGGGHFSDHGRGTWSTACACDDIKKRAYEVTARQGRPDTFSINVPF
ncbi:hypothetical protein [Streptomyces griseoluteus]|uniref:hypothetical protein n=1 Tax=Streptomyces griseoluteus TaxID=29306 RepID=UPI003692F5DC